MLRRTLKLIYDSLSDREKTLWAISSGYTSYQGLYQYLRNNPDAYAYDKIMKGLKKTVGEERFSELSKQYSEFNNFDFKDLKAEFLRLIPTCENPKELQIIKDTLEFGGKLVNNQIERLALLKD